MEYFYLNKDGEAVDYVPACNETVEDINGILRVKVDTGAETYHKDVVLSVKAEVAEEKPKKKAPAKKKVAVEAPAEVVEAPKTKKK